ncbi:MAG: tripartite tricarboxylate transporter substrate binding protein [Pseudolabrys sp.]
MLAATPAVSQEWVPNRSLRLILPFAPGGTADIIGRLLAQYLTEALGQSVIVENKSGGGNIIATDALTHSAPDGYTLGMISTPHATNATLIKNLPYDPIKSIDPLTLIGRTPIVVLVSDTSASKSVADLLAQDKKSGPLSYGSPGNGSAANLAGELFKIKSDSKLVHIAYRGGAPAMNDLMAGHIQVLFNAFTSTLPFIQSGKFRVMALADVKRSPLIPDAPTLTEAGYPGLEMYEWFGIVLPAGTPANIKSRLHAEMIKFMKTDVAKARLSDQGVELVPQSQEEFAAYIAQEISRDRDIITKAGLKAE